MSGNFNIIFKFSKTTQNVHILHDFSCFWCILKAIIFHFDFYFSKIAQIVHILAISGGFRCISKAIIFNQILYFQKCFNTRVTSVNTQIKISKSDIVCLHSVDTREMDRLVI